MIFKKLKSESGIALMLVLSSLLIMTTIVVEFAYNSHIAYEMAASERDRLQAYYLAKSGLNLNRLMIKTEKGLRGNKMIGDALQQMGTGAGFASDPLCKQIPLSTGLLKGIASGALMGNTKDGEGADTEEPQGEAAEEAPDMVAGAEEFLSFDGDFESHCDTEERKINLNLFRADPNAAVGGVVGNPAPPPKGAAALLSPAMAAALYWEQKNMLLSLLSQEEFEPLFKDKKEEMQKVVHAIADWADKDDRINEAPGVNGAPEESDYSDPQYTYKVKNGRYATVSELLLVAGVGDDLYRKLEPHVTVYGDTQVNLCQASDELVKAFIDKYSRSTPGVTPIAAGDETRWKTVLDSVRQACSSPSPQKGEIASAIAQGLGSATAGNLASQIKTDNRFYRIESTGISKESQVKIVSVIDTLAPNANLWKTLYYRVE